MSVHGGDRGGLIFKGVKLPCGTDWRGFKSQQVLKWPRTPKMRRAGNAMHKQTNKVKLGQGHNKGQQLRPIWADLTYLPYPYCITNPT